MYTSQFDEKAQIFYVTLAAAVDVHELARALSDCFAADFDSEVSALWDITQMRVEFGMGDVNQLIEVVEASAVPEGKFAFVVGHQAFLRSVVESIRGMRQDWATQWRIFDEHDAALSWLAAESR